MEFRDFARPLLDTVYAHMNNGLGVRQMFLDITEFDDVDSNPFLVAPESTFRGYLQKGRGITKAAGNAIAHLNKEKFAEVIYRVSDDALNLLLKAYARDIPDADASNIGEKIADMFEAILSNAASGTKDAARHNAGNEVTGEALASGLLQETNGHCPKCGALFARGKKGGQSFVVSITPLEAKQDYRVKKTYEAVVPQMPALGSPQDKIALCVSCAADYEKDHSPERFKELVELKARMRRREDIADELAALDLERDLPTLLSQLGQVRDFSELTVLEYDALRVREKVSPENQMLILKVESFVTTYYNFIREQCQILEAQGDLDFDMLASQVRMCYLKLRKAGLNQEAVFDRIKEWMVDKTGCERPSECEALVAFFVQNCEVFDAIAG